LFTSHRTDSNFGVEIGVFGHFLENYPIFPIGYFGIPDPSSATSITVRFSGGSRPLAKPMAASSDPVMRIEALYELAGLRGIANTQ
jgi:hypothetical protein